MSKVQGSWASVIKGVSQQAPIDRLEGQHGEQLNMIADPVRGLTRRNGFILDAEQVKTLTGDPSDALADSFSYRRYTFREAETNYDFLYRSRERVGAASANHLDTVMLYNKTTKAFLPCVPAGDAATQLFESGGISAMTSIGSYVLLAGNAIAPSWGYEAAMDNLAWKYTAAIWVRGGGYARTFRVRAVRQSTGQDVTVVYTTPQVNYPGVLNLTLPPPFDAAIGTPYEQYFLNIIRAQYDTAVNQWSAAASAAIVPSAIALELATRLNATGFTGWTTRGAHLLNDDVRYVEVDDGGDGLNIRALLQDAKSADDMTDIHRVGKVIRVQPSSSQSDSYYLKAYAAVSGDPNPYQTVIWREAAGDIQRPATVLAFGRIVSGTFYWASGPTELRDHVLAQTGVTLDVPTYFASNAGDRVTVKPPRFFGNRITMLTVFQDRLLIGSGSTINASKVGDYLNFYRSTMLTVPNDDPVEMFALGTEDDTIRTSVLYDRNLLILGDKFHYAISGRQALDASAPSMAVQFTMDGAADATPVGVAKNVFILKEDNQLAASRLLQVAAGAYQDSPSIDDVSKPLRDYINGTPAEMVALASPSMVVIRTEHFLKSKGGYPRARPWGLYVYQFLDNEQGQRLTEAWSAWEWSTSLGTPIGISTAETGDAITLYTVAFGTNPAGFAARSINVFHCSARPDPTGLPYLDGLRPAADGATMGLLTPSALPNVQEVVYTSPGAAHSYSPVPATTDAARFIGLEDPNYTVGDAPPESVDPFRWTGVQGWLSDYTLAYPLAPADNLWTGVAFPAFVDLTNQFAKDHEGKAKTMGNLTLTKLWVTTTRTAGLKATYRDNGVERTVLDYKTEYERINYKHSVWVGRDVKRVQVRLSAVDWRPLTISAINWQGNWFGSRGRM